MAYWSIQRVQPSTPIQIEITEAEDGTLKYTQPGLFGFIPSLGYNFKF